jgi:hypothetical protein
VVGASVGGVGLVVMRSETGIMGHERLNIIEYNGKCVILVPTRSTLF